LGAARSVAGAAAQSALNIAEYNLRLVSDSHAAGAFRRDIVRLRQ
jgi:hypothetical protein